MKLLYVAGLEHSGTTLLSHLLGASGPVLVLGEVGRFFSPAGMHAYVQRWRDYPDHRTCSCGQEWDRCPFWSELVGLNGLNSELPLAQKYRLLFEHVRTRYPGSPVLVDSTKSFGPLRMLVEERENVGLQPGDLQVAMAVRDVRGFVSMIARRSPRGANLADALRTSNWWVASNRKTLEFLHAKGVPHDLVFYELFCSDPLPVLARLLDRLGVQPPGQLGQPVSGNSAHMVLGNKEYLRRDRHAVRYDARWMLDDISAWAYLLHLGARRFNRELWQRAQSTEAGAIALERAGLSPFAAMPVVPGDGDG